VSVRWIGAQRDVLGGDVEGKVDLRSLASLSHLYALGPRAGVPGEITVFDGEPCIARVVDGRVQVEARPDHTACFLVYDEVPAWQETTLARPVDGEAALTAAGLAAAHAAQVDVDQPLIFLLRAPAATVTFHVLDKRDGLRHTPALHEQAKVRLRVEKLAAAVLGFYSSRHRGIFTPRESDLHMHLRTLDGRASGHVEQIAVGAGTVIALPRRETR
jgi:acetolactate decarboxylase